MLATPIGKRYLLIAVSAALAGFAAAACGSDGGSGGGDSGLAKVSKINQTVALEDLKAVGFKDSKTYDVEGLTGAKAAYFGFWGLDPYDRHDYEVRFYPTHQDAVELGMALAEERVGETAKLDEETASWPVGLKEARTCGGDEASGPASHGIQACTQARYKSYFIYGNMILFCQGGNVDESDKRCRELLTELEEAA